MEQGGGTTLYLVSAEFFDDMTRNYRRSVDIGDLTPEEIHAMTTSKVVTDEHYNLADIPDDVPSLWAEGELSGPKSGP